MSRAFGGHDWVREVKARVRLADLVSGGTLLKRMGRTLRGPCPIHGGSGPNFSVDPQRNVFRCFVCDASGDAFDFLRLTEGLEFLEAATRLAHQLGVVIPDRREPRVQAPAEVERHRHQQALVQGVDRAAWDSLGLGSVVDTERLGSGVGHGPQAGSLAIPVGGTADTPLGWVRLTRAMDAAGVATPVPLGLDTVGEARAGQGLYVPEVARYAMRRDVALVVDHPVTVLALQAAGYPAACAPVLASLETADASLLSPEQIGQLAAAGVRTVMLVWPVPAAARAAWQRALFATEPLLIAAGIQPLVWRTEDVAPFATSSWECFAALDWQVEAIRQAAASRVCVDVFEWRVEHVVRARRREGGLSADEAVAKLAPTLRAALASGDRVLYHAYVAWAARALHLPDRRALTRATVVPAATLDDSEEF